MAEFALDLNEDRTEGRAGVCSSEPDAGSDVSATRTSAVHDEAGEA
ncbi:hypothetical protein [Streptomyces sp. CNQ085]|nr:hypothetical protein [Streptomyces sp. CNQ085]MCI0385645.1 hypothetical protein [Streptomyces sp. CNQ085]